MNTPLPHDVPPVFLLLDDSGQVRNLVARTLNRLIAGSIIVEASCNREAIEILTARKVSGIVEDFQRIGEDAIDLEFALIDLEQSRPEVILYTGSELCGVKRAFEKRGLTMDERFAAVVQKIDTELLADRIVAEFTR